MAKTHLERVLETSFCSIQNALFTLVEENQRLKAELNKERTEGQRLRDETEVLKDDVLRLVTECKRLERKIKETPTEALCEALEENNRLKAFSAQLELELNAYKLKLDRLKAELAHCKEAMKLYKPCNAAYERANEKMRAELEKYISVANIAISFVDLKPEHSLYESIRQDLIKALKTLKERK